MPKQKSRAPQNGIPTLSLFSGAGGLDIGFLQAGFDIKACVEIEKAYSKSLEANVGGNEGYGPDTVIHNVDIRKFDTAPYRDAGIRCVIGGPPCQTFSAAGRRSGGVLGTEDERGQLFLEYCRVLDEIKPEVFVFENVYGLPGANGGEPWAEITTAFAERGYHLKAEVLDAADYGVPQHRERLILVGYKSGDFAFPLPTHGPDSLGNLPLVSVEAAIDDFQSVDEPYHDNLGGMYGHLLPLVPEGLNYSFFTAEMNHPEPVFAWRSKFHDLLYKVDRKAPCRTIKAQPGKFTGPFHWKNRHFTERELKRLQSFPDEYLLVGTRGKVLEQIGNSVPPRLANVIAEAVKDQLLEKKDILRFPPRPHGFVSTFRQRQRERTKHFAEVAAKAIAARYSGISSRSMDGAAESSSYMLLATGLYDRAQAESVPVGFNGRSYEIRVREVGQHIDLEIIQPGRALSSTSTVEIDGLNKYLPNFASLKLRASIRDLEDIFHCWAAIEKTLTSRSRFFTLIDIYGHYANRGDTVDIRSDWSVAASPAVLSILNYFGSTKHCGGFESTKRICAKTGLTLKELQTAVSSLRDVRFDIRSNATHPIIKGDSVICTYPFPLLSPRAMVVSKAQPIIAPAIEDKEDINGQQAYGN